MFYYQLWTNITCGSEVFIVNFGNVFPGWMFSTSKEESPLPTALGSSSMYEKNFLLVHYLTSDLRRHGRLWTIVRTSDKNVWSNFFWYIKEYIFWNFIQYTIHRDKTQMLKKNIPSDKINVIKNVLFFLSRAPTHHSFTFNSQLLYELKYNFLLFHNFLFTLDKGWWLKQHVYLIIHGF